MAAKALRAFLTLLRKLPYNIASSFGASIGWVLWAVSFSRVNRLERRCVAALGIGVTNAREIIRSSYVNMGRVFAEFFSLNSRSDTLKHVVIKGEEHLKDALSQGRGVLIMTAHLSNWEIAAAAACYKGYPLHAIYTPQRNTAGLEDVLRRQREKVCGIGLIPSQGNGIKEAFKVLKSKEILIILQDLDARQDGVETSFLGLPAMSHMGLIKLHKRFGSPIIPARTLREKDGNISLIFYPPLQLDEDMEKSLSICNNVIECWVNEHPEQWMWILDRWESTFGKCY